MDGIVPVIAGVIILGLGAACLATIFFLFASYKRKFHSNTPFYVALSNSVVLALLGILSFNFSSTVIGNSPFWIILVVLALSVYAVVRINQNTEKADGN